MVNFKDWIYEQLPNRFREEDTDIINGKGLFQRFVESMGAEIDSNITPSIAVLTDLNLVLTTEEYYVAYIAWMMGNPPNTFNHNEFYRQILRYLIPILKIKGTALAYEAFFGILGIQATITEIDLEDMRYDTGKIYDVGYQYDLSCPPCSDYILDIVDPNGVMSDWETNPITLAMFLAIVKFLEPINARMRDWSYVDHDGPRLMRITVSSSDPEIGAVTGGGEFPFGTTVTIDAFELGDGIFLHWSHNGEIVSTNETYSFSANASMHFIANFCGPVEVDYNCEVNFDFFDPSPVSVLSVGNLVGDPCELDEYVIDWYRDGVHELVSGVGSDPDIEAYHPFIGLASIPVLPGTWIPKLRYIIVDGVKINNQPIGCEDWSSIPNLDTVIIVVAPLNCSSTSGNASYYSYRINYVATNDYAFASRKLQFDLGGDVKYLAIRFDGNIVADKLEIYFNGETLLYSVIVGTENNPTNLAVIPKKLNFSSSYKILEIPPHTAGDHLVIEVTPSVTTPNHNTNWALYLKCFGEGTELNCGEIVPSGYAVESVNLEYSAAKCAYLFTYKPVQYIPDLFLAGQPLEFLSVYGLNNIQHAMQSYTADNINKTFTYELSYRKILYSAGISQPGGNTNHNSLGLVNYKKTGNIVEVTYSDSADYDVVYQSWLALQATAYFTDFVDDNTDLKYYRYILANIYMSEIGCGDQSTLVKLVIHPNSTLVFNGTNKLTITLATITNGITEIPCDTTYSNAISLVFTVNNFYNRSNFNYNSLCNPVAFFGATYYLNSQTTQSTTREISAGTFRGNLDDEAVPCTGTNVIQQYNNSTGIWVTRIKVKITAAIDIDKLYLEDPEDNYEVYQVMDSNGHPVSGLGTLIYKKVGGVETVNLLPA